MKDATLLRYYKSLDPQQREAFAEQLRATVEANQVTARIGELKKVKLPSGSHVRKMLGAAPWWKPAMSPSAPRRVKEDALLVAFNALPSEKSEGVLRLIQSMARHCRR
jgi:hypothetical protein